MYKYLPVVQTSIGGGFLKNQTEKNGATKSRFRGFYTALGCSLVMIGAACYFAYHQTSTTLEQNLDSITEQIAVPNTENAVVTTAEPAQALGVQTDVEMETMTESVIEEAVETEPLTTETQPEVTEPETEEEPVHQLVPPLTEYRVLNAFSDGELVKSETTGTWQTHNGVDLACAANADVYAIDVGTVTEICKDALWGYTITIDHDNGIVSRYCGLDGSVDVHEGDTVQSGQKIGKVGDTADIESALETHLHLEVQKSGEYIDPEAYLG